MTHYDSCRELPWCWWLWKLSYWCVRCKSTSKRQRLNWLSQIKAASTASRYCLSVGECTCIAVDTAAVGPSCRFPPESHTLSNVLIIYNAAYVIISYQTTNSSRLQDNTKAGSRWRWPTINMFTTGIPRSPGWVLSLRAVSIQWMSAPTRHLRGHSRPSRDNLINE